MNAKRKRAVRAWLVGLSVLAVAIGAGCGGAAKVIGRGAGRAAGHAAPEAVHVAPAALRAPAAPLTSSAGKAAAAAPGRAGKAASKEGGGLVDHVPWDNLIPTGGGNGNDNRKK
jgi:hypothetical protein